MSGVLAGRKALVTGAGRGIGEAIALAFAREGADVVLVSRTIGQLNEVKEKIEALGRRAVAIPTDMGDHVGVLDLADKALDALGGMDIVVSNAAFGGGLVHMLDISPEQWRHTQAANVEGPLLLLKELAPHFFEKGSGNIIFVSSIRGTNGAPGTGAYGASKAALNSVTKTLACEWGPMGVRVNAICPGPVDTQMIAEAFTGNRKLYDYFGKLAPLKRWTQAEDCAGPAVFLASDAARAITGHLLIVDGGLTAILQDAFPPPADL